MGNFRTFSVDLVSQGVLTDDLLSEKHSIKVNINFQAARNLKDSLVSGGFEKERASFVVQNEAVHKVALPK